MILPRTTRDVFTRLCENGVRRKPAARNALFGNFGRVSAGERVFSSYLNFIYRFGRFNWVLREVQFILLRRVFSVWFISYFS